MKCSSGNVAMRVVTMLCVQAILHEVFQMDWCHVCGNDVSYSGETS